MDPSSSAVALDDDAHGPLLETSTLEQICLQTAAQSYIPSQPLTPHQTPFHGFSSLYTAMPPGSYAGPQHGWSMPLWYSPVAVTGRYCPTPPYPPATSFMYGSVVPNMAYNTDKAFHTVAAASISGVGDILDIEQTRTRPRTRAAKQKPSNEIRVNRHGDGSSQNLVPTSEFLPSTTSNGTEESVSRQNREANVKQPTFVDTSHELIRHGHCLNDDFDGSLSSAIQQGPICSKSPSPPWSESGLPLFSSTFRVQSASMIDIAKSQGSLCTPADTVPVNRRYIEAALQPRNACRTAALLGSSKPRKTPSQETEPLLRPEMKNCDLKEAQALLKAASTNVKRSIIAGPVKLSKKAESRHVRAQYLDSYASEEEWPRLGKRIMGDSAPAISRIPHLKVHIRDVAPDASMAMRRSRSEDGTAANTTKKTSHKGAFNAIKGPTQSSVASRVSEGSWSQSKRWMSQETKERMGFHKTMQNLHHIGADKSPFVPQTPLELTAFRAEMAEIRKRRLSREVKWRMSTLERRRALANDPNEQHMEVASLLEGKKLPDKLSAVFASQNCFRDYISHDDAQWVTWPSLAELKGVGDKRSGRHERYLPLPKLKTDATEKAMHQGEDFDPTDETGHGGTESMKADTRFIRSLSHVAESLSLQTPELAFDDLPGYLQRAMIEMEQELDD
ncbi:hypothetical protein ED733_003485 [Metarhizium rileyi]|uniref:Uncharacterized protein n=1 Tax=Metarhizium rileyi (strain RCEF 4871) TaxID=1649241 RepID=A0A5C6GBZ1_METRR|nr:hypothetical protein ED733_003485 [Metarhizium rileyi]